MTDTTREDVARKALDKIEHFFKQGIDDRTAIGCIGDVLKEYHAALAALRLAQDAVVIVPREPTEAMINASIEPWVALYPAFPNEKPQPTAGEVAQTIYRAMIAASPLRSGESK